uniref:Uncharacterized protein n=1 Tax=Poecilia mexicana TaxID=48701 RepID=A0A3B3X472_9TELE
TCLLKAAHFFLLPSSLSRMSSTRDRGVLGPAHKARNMPKHFFITCQMAFHLVSIQTSPLLFVTRREAVLIFDSDEQIMHMTK